MVLVAAWVARGEDARNEVRNGFKMSECDHNKVLRFNSPLVLAVVVIDL